MFPLSVCVPALIGTGTSFIVGEMPQVGMPVE